MLSDYLVRPTLGKKLAGLMLATGLSTAASAQLPVALIGTDQNATTGVADNIRDFLSANRGTNGGGDQSLQGGDALLGTESADVLIGALGIDALFGYGANDVLIGGTEDFNPFNRDRAFGGEGDDTFIWAPGDGNDFFDGREGVDVLMIGLIGEERDSDGGTVGAPFFNVSLPNADGSQDFDGIFLESSSGLPIVNVAGGPGFCDVI
ncbi:MAG: calcium-binding protein, partial [Pseudomonadales bacterium]